MTNAQKAAVMTWLEAMLALAALFIPGLEAAAQLAIITAGGATLTMYIALTYKDSPARKADDPMVQYEEGRANLETKTSIAAPTVEAIVQGDANRSSTARAAEGWPPPQNTEPPTGGNAA